ncbi:MAG: hypothetical protein BAJATHORv1_90009 [Candidatus Thorarchaeota archaeon]|nr:MAG: hypothetical protein BAJATHORv1_90009 [Candidatus Thorarchaeota archaeon]
MSLVSVILSMDLKHELIKSVYEMAIVFSPTGSRSRTLGNSICY